MRLFIKFAYQGSDFHGSQSQPNGETVQSCMEKALYTLLRIPIALVFAGRTDAGVHAEMMWAHCDIAESLCRDIRWRLDTDEGRNHLVFRLNRILPSSIAIRLVVPVIEQAHARFDAVARTYEYRILCRKDPFLYPLRTYVYESLDFGRMNEAASYLLGRQDFSSFCRTHTDVKTKYCTITRAEWSKDQPYSATFTITADRFLRNMVRAVVGTLFEVGKGRISIQAFQDIIVQCDRQKAGESAPAQGLYLTEILYPQDIFLDIPSDRQKEG